MPARSRQAKDGQSVRVGLDAGGHHTRLVTANNWSAYGGSCGYLCFRHFAADGNVLDDWKYTLQAANAANVLASSYVRQRFTLPDFTRP